MIMIIDTYTTVVGLKDVNRRSHTKLTYIIENFSSSRTSFVHTFTRFGDFVAV